MLATRATFVSANRFAARHLARSCAAAIALTLAFAGAGAGRATAAGGAGCHRLARPDAAALGACLALSAAPAVTADFVDTEAGCALAIVLASDTVVRGCRGATRTGATRTGATRTSTARAGAARTSRTRERGIHLGRTAGTAGRIAIAGSGGTACTAGSDDAARGSTRDEGSPSGSALRQSIGAGPIEMCRAPSGPASAGHAVYRRRPSVADWLGPGDASLFRDRAVVATGTTLGPVATQLGRVDAAKAASKARAKQGHGAGDNETIHACGHVRLCHWNASMNTTPA